MSKPTVLHGERMIMPGKDCQTRIKQVHVHDAPIDDMS